MVKLLAKIISLLSAPALVLCITVFLLVMSSNLIQAMYGLVFLVVGGLPPMILNMYQFLHEKDLEFDPDRNARQSIYLVAVLGFVVDAAIFGSEYATNIFWANLAMVMAILFACAYLVNKYFDKFSMHLALYAFAVMLLTDKLHTSFAILFIFAPLIIWARMRLRRHTWVQVLWGWALGLAIGLLAWTV